MTELQRLRKLEDDINRLTEENCDLGELIDKKESSIGRLEKEIDSLQKRIEELESQLPEETGWDCEKKELLIEHWSKITVEDVRAITIQI